MTANITAIIATKPMATQTIVAQNVDMDNGTTSGLGEGTKVNRYLGGDTSLSFSEAGSPPMPQCVLGIS